jgi:hypothetical protein
LAHMLGVQRTTIAVTTSALQKNGYIRTGRGTIELIDVSRINTAACSCRQATAYAAAAIYASREKVCEA